MSNYTPIVNYAAKDALSTGNPSKKILGTEITAELTAIQTAISSKEDSANKNVANGYCGLDSSVLIPVARLPATVAQTNVANTFSASQFLSLASPALQFFDSTGPTGDKRWRIVVSSGTLSLQTMTDDGASAVTTALQINRSSGGVSALALTGTAVTINGGTAWHSLNDGSGSGLDADLLDGLNSSAFALASHTHAAADVTSGTFADGRIALSNVSQHQASITTRNITGKSGIAKTLSTSAPSGGSDGDIWYRY